ncbi:MAG: RpiB/LacA/LacB family sugar-phosphate isomerase [Opitutales bacterium]|nr:RpiB/LacA/LacB family sugar-phosphate isomerase [Opitutales bacterium]
MRKIKTILLLAAAVCFSASLFAQAKKTAILASDPIGLKIKDAVKDLLVKEGFEVVDLTGSEHQNYVDVGFNLGREMNDKKYDFGFVFCGTGMGVNLVANKFKNVYCALCETEEAAKMARIVNNANVLAMGGKFTDEARARQIALAFIKTEFSNDAFLRGCYKRVQEKAEEINKINSQIK